MKAIEIEGLKKVYANGVAALKGIDLRIDEGDFFAILGANGAGKSTTLNIITSLVRKTAGHIKIFGIDIDADFNKAKSYVGIVPQEFNFNIFETVEQIVINQAGYYGVNYKLAKQRAEKYLRQLELWDKRKEASKSLSGGMKRRLMIARALMAEPKLLILDEPTAGVDVEIRRSMWQFLQDINTAGKTIILTTHYLEEAEILCKNVAIINAGRIVENASMKELVAKLSLETFVLNTAGPNTKLNLGDFAHRVIDLETIEVDIAKGQNLNRLFQALEAQNIKVLSLRNKSNRLEELFLNITK